jgi:hypothetical protein
MHKNHPITRFWHSQTVRGTRHFASPRRWYRYLTAGRRALPRVIIAGAQKAGTTSLFGYLAGHPQCLRPLTKEINYFDQNYTRGERWYRMHFPVDARDVPTGPRHDACCIEASPHYMFEPQVAQRVSRLLPGAKVIFLLRNPVARAYSHYQHQVRRGQETRPFDACLALEVEQHAGRPSHASPRHAHGATPLSYLARGRYVDQLRNWQQHFPAGQMLVIESERMFKRPGEIVDEVLAFLGLEPWRPSELGNLNPGGYTRPMSPAARSLASDYFAQHNERLFQFLGRRFTWN